METVETKKLDRPFVLQLQSVRALAALTVAGYHSLGFTRLTESQERWKRGMENILYGQGAVFVFFIVSGFVLGLSLVDRPRNFRACRIFLWRRFTRLFPAILVSSCIYAAYFAWVYQAGDFDLGNTELIYDIKVSFGELAKNALLLSKSFNGVTWSLQVEALFSILLPFIFLVTGRSWKLHLAVLAAFLAIYDFTDPGQWGLRAADAPWWYLFICYAGFIMAVYRRQIVEWYGRLPRAAFYLLMAVALAICLSTPHFGNHFDLFTLGAVYLIGMIISDRAPFLSGFLNAKPLIWLGTISYSFYLLHPLFLLLCISAMWSHLPAQVVTAHPMIASLLVCVVSVGLTIPSAWLSYYVCERPFTSAHRQVEKRLPELHGL